ncbi:MAG: insulinase family protein, partial [Bacteroidetes bacterium]|nr:insulinase family protein [Bacteroidota bacterium]
MEHMSFNGTINFPHNELMDYLQKAGVRFGADINAYTGFDETVYQLPLPSDDPKVLHTGIGIMHDWCQGALLDSVEIEKERGVVLEEKRLRSGSDNRLHEACWPIIVNQSRYAVREPIGLDTILHNFRYRTLQRFYRDWYRPDLQALIIVGDINADSLVRVVKATFADLKNPGNERKRAVYQVPLSGKNQFITVTDKEATIARVQLLFKFPQVSMSSANDYRSYIVRTLFERMLAKRYARLSREAHVPFVDASANIRGYVLGLSAYGIQVYAKSDSLLSAVKAAYRQSWRIRQAGFTDAELRQVKTAYLSGMENILKEKDKRFSQNFVQEYQSYFVAGISAPGIERELQLIHRFLPNIMLDDVNRLAKTLMSGANRDIILTAPETDKDRLPDEAAILSCLKLVEQEQIKPYHPEISNKPLLAEKLVQGKVTSKTYDPALNLTTWKLNNGLTVLLKPTAFQNDQLLFTGFAPGGTSLYSDADYPSAANAAAVIPAGGAGNYSAGQLMEWIQQNEVNVKPYISEREEGISGSCPAYRLEAALQLVHGWFTEPRKDSTRFTNIITRSRTNIESRKNDPSAIFSDTVSAVVGNHNLRRTGPTLEKLNQINLDKAYNIYRERFANAAAFKFVLVGNIDTTTVRPLLEKYLGSLLASDRIDTAHDLDIYPPAGQVQKTVYKGIEKKTTVLLVWSGRFDDTRDNRIKLDALKECLQIRLIDRLREEESEVYSPGVFVNYEKYPQGYYELMVQFGCAPENVEHLVDAVKSEIARIATDRPAPGSLKKWREEDRRSMQTDQKTNNFWLSYICSKLRNNEDLHDLLTYDHYRDGISETDVQYAARQYASGKNLIKLVLMPETAKNNNAK